MNPPASHPAADRVPRWLLAGSFALTVAAVAVAFGHASTLAAWSMLGALLVAAGTVGWVVRRVAARRAALQAEVRRQADRLVQFAAGQERFVDRIAHEIRTPLTIVQNHAELLGRCSSDPAAVRAHAKSLADYTRHFAALLEGFLRLGGPSVGPDTSHHVPVHVHDLVVEAVRRCQSLARGRGVGIVLTLVENDREDGVWEVLGDEALLEAMLESLVRHAVRGSARGAQVEVTARANGASVLLHVRDHGTVLAPCELASVFDWFFQAPGTAPQAGANGGGLAIGRRIAEHHRGTIVAQDHPDGGCEFVVTLPRWRGQALPSSGAGVPERTPPPTRPAGAAATPGDGGSR